MSKDKPVRIRIRVVEDGEGNGRAIEKSESQYYPEAKSNIEIMAGEEQIGRIILRKTELY